MQWPKWGTRIKTWNILLELKQQTSNAGIYNILHKLWRARLPLENPNFCVTVLAILDVVASLYRYTSSTLCQSTWLRLSFRLWIAAAKRNNIEFRWGRGGEKKASLNTQREREGWFTHRLKSRAPLRLNSSYFLPREVFTAGINLSRTSSSFGDHLRGYFTSFPSHPHFWGERFPKYSLKGGRIMDPEILEVGVMIRWLPQVFSSL